MHHYHLKLQNISTWSVDKASEHISHHWALLNVYWVNIILLSLQFAANSVWHKLSVCKLYYSTSSSSTNYHLSVCCRCIVYAPQENQMCQFCHHHHVVHHSIIIITICNIVIFALWSSKYAYSKSCQQNIFVHLLIITQLIVIYKASFNHHNRI